LEGNVMAGQDLPEPFSPDPHLPCRHLCRVVVAVAALQVGGQFLTLKWVNGSPSFLGRVVAVATMNAMSSSLMRRGAPPAQ